VYTVLNVLTSDSDTTFTAPQSIVALAFSTALDERGETGGQSGAQMLAYARQELSNAIALDANQHEEELTWTTV
jgi:hypothetical protein